MGSITLLISKHNVKIRRIKACFKHTSLAIVDHHAGLFTLKVFKNQYVIEFLLPTGECYRECERFAKRIVNNMNDIPTWLIGMSPNNTDEPQLSKETIVRFLLASDLVWSPSLYKIQKIVVGKNSPIPVLYYLDETGPQCPFVREKLIYIKEKPILPSR
ncbi:3613_t:CDS:2 [Dentiscutata erythropus]|uniref:3613_t:CDS:1 n=1 Tax=Dentiscutata erythropus TaxID=1348616 RepID=A0A9N9FSB2_9GLOM|nr:3613_t:CDS:2 [Dentiscutata erythropus]